MTQPDQGLPSGHLVGTLRDILANARSAYQKDDLKRAEEILRQVVEAEPGLATAWHLRGLIARRKEDHVRAGEYFAAAAARSPDTALYCRDFGVSLATQGRKHEALEILERAMALGPEDAATHFHIGNVLLGLGRPRDAVSFYQRAVELEPESPESHNNLAAALRDCGQTAQSIAAAEAALSIRPDYSEALNNLALALCDVRRYPQAIERFEAALSLDPGNPEVLNNAGVALHADGRLGEAEQRLRAALAIRPGWGEAALNLGNLLRQQSRLEEAVELYRDALAADPMDIKSYGNLGLALLNLNKPREAISIYEKALSLAPDNADIRMSLGIAQLMLGEYAPGWENYERRWQAMSFTARKRSFESPLWDGGSSAGQRILVHAEQGFGDTLQFCRYVPLLAAQGASVIFECQRPLMRLCESLEGVVELIPRGAALPRSDAHIPLLSLPRIFSTTLATIPANGPYLRPPDDTARAWRERIETDDFKIGLVWTGDPKRQDDILRSCPKAALAPILSVPGVRFFSLQVGDSPDATMPNVTDLGSSVADFADTAGALSALDLTITVDTAVAHLAGALGRPVWVMLGVHADWRYLMDREDSPWYPTMRLFRQDRRGDWTGLAARVAASLRQRLGSGVAGDE